ncbi:MAG: class I fructose-bisphosphate aldolase [Pseudomonadota bacterium]|nr:class I fructose-bisphosphate aldolase [Pseudomonadota bacterium]
MNIDNLASVAGKMVENNKGLLAADESTGTIAKRLDSIGVVSTEETRRDYRELLFSTKGLEEFISGAILYDETLRQDTKDGGPISSLLINKGLLVGIKVDMGAKSLAGAEGEKVTEGLDGLEGRVNEYVEMGAAFAKWRAVINIGISKPSNYCINVNAHALARYAKICQEGGLVPIVEPEVLMDGDHTIDQCAEVTQATLDAVFSELFNQRVALEGIILKPNMVISGSACIEQASVEEVAKRTIVVLKRAVPAAVKGIMFLSGGQAEDKATEHLHTMNKSKEGLPWILSYSYGRALQESALKAWKGDNNNTLQAQGCLLERAKLNSAACAV